ncbi:gamma carbonic anhydrase family protein [Mesorhizobium sp. CU2]|uniref:gamma carbonic anhydrase family protein n=1 Tax=unclassified Mesorhizobium TaxID=325217 RepID=UPI00112B6266|nr:MULTISPECIES: gamma carbonic anhydrase family protein [unclassified Mesorhizobium]TPN81054.1 gamma carbonic anhydrase family protein [Mesorhizobium sp. CU3]TPO09809.1 gamma carbonic anhydrase family protein [Mesorhizobium sp. CU2]
MLFALGSDAPQFHGAPVWIAPGACIIGRAHIGKLASIWFNAVIRADNEVITIGDRANVQDGAVLHADPGYPLTIGSDCTVGHRAILHGCTIEDRCLIGMGSTVLNGAHIGHGSIVGANALVPERKTIPPYSLVVGVPGRVVRQLGSETTSYIEHLASEYVGNAGRFGAEMRMIE